MSSVTRSSAARYPSKVLSPVEGVAQISGDLSVTGKLTAASFAGDGGELSNIRPMNDSVGGAQLASDPESLSKVSAGKVIVKGNRVGVGVQSPDGDCILDVGARMRVKQGESASAGIWFAQSGADHSAFVGMADDNKIGFYGHGVGWGLTMRGDDGAVTLAGALSVGGKVSVASLGVSGEIRVAGSNPAHRRRSSAFHFRQKAIRWLLSSEVDFSRSGYQWRNPL